MQRVTTLPACAVLGAAWLAMPATVAGKPRDVAAHQQQTDRAAVPRRVPAAQPGTSYYAPSLAGRRTAARTRFNPNPNMAASKTLPLGGTARVTELENGRSTTARVEDRGLWGRTHSPDPIRGLGRFW